MRVFSKELLEAACRHCNVDSPGEASLLDNTRISGYLESSTGIPMIHLELGSPGFSANKVGVEAEKAALDAGVASKYPPVDGLPVLKEASSRFVKAFLNIDLPPICHIPTTGSMLAVFAAMAAAEQCRPGGKILVLEPSFSANKQQMAIMGIGWEGVEVTALREGDFEENLRNALAGEFAAIIYSNPNNPSWMCISEDELKIIAKVADERGIMVIEDLAYFCMDSRGGYGIPYTEPYPPTVARYTDNYMVLLSGSKIFSYAGQRIGVLCIGQGLYHKRFQSLAARYGGYGIFGQTMAMDILGMITAGCTSSTQYALAAMMDRSCDGAINFALDVSGYTERAARMKEIFLRNSFIISYEEDAMGPIADGFFFTVGYPGISSSCLVDELLAYGVSTVSLHAMGSDRQGVRVCSSRICGDQFALLQERMAAFREDHPAQ